MSHKPLIFDVSARLLPACPPFWKSLISHGFGVCPPPLVLRTTGPALLGGGARYIETRIQPVGDHQPCLQENDVMSAEAPALVHTFRVGHRICTITVQMPGVGIVTNMTVEWSPDAPTGLSRSELNQYRKGRDQVAAELGDWIGGNVAVVEY